MGVRDADYGAFAWAPGDPLLERWRDVYAAVARGNGGEPDAGRYLRGWAWSAGFSHVVSSASTWCYTDAAARGWAQMLADRTESTDLAVHAVDAGIATASELADIAAAWRRWGEHRDAWFVVVHAEARCTP